MANNETFRTCPRTGLQFHDSAEMLMKANAVVGVVFLLLGGVLALLIGLTKWPDVHLLPADSFYLVLTAHGLDMLVFWIIFFEIAVLYFCSSTLLRCRLATPRMAWLAFSLMLFRAVTLVTFGAVTAAIIAVFTIASGAIILIPTFLWSVGYIKTIDPLMYRVIWWAFGHSSQQINVA